MTYTLGKICEIVKGQCLGDPNVEVARLLTDSRSLTFPEETLFFALCSDRNDGHNYINNLYSRGVRCFVVNHIESSFEQHKDANFIVVSDTLKALQILAASHRSNFDIPVLAITGSNGKTIVKEWIYQLLSDDIVMTRSPRSYNSQIGVPLSIWNIDERTQMAVIEAGISKPGEMKYLKNIINPTLGLLTHVGVAHEENFSTKREKVEEKIQLFSNVDTLIYRSDNETVKTVVEENCKCNLFSWSTTHGNSSLYVSSIEKRLNTTFINCCYQGENYGFAIPFIDDASIENSIGCFAVAVILKADLHVVCERMSRLESVAMRLEVKEGIRGLTLINDYYNSDIHSLEIALDFMSRRPDKFNRQRTLIISDIDQSGMTDSDLYGQVSALVEQHKVGKLIGIGSHIKSCADLFSKTNAAFFLSVENFLNSQYFAELNNEVILLKGGRRFEFERITDLLVQKVHETILEVNLDALVDNLNYYRSFLHPTTKMVCMIKADAYGIGAVEVAKTLQDHQVDYLAVAVADEGVTLRNNGITSNIMIMNPEMGAFRKMFDNDLEPEVYSFRLLNAMIEAAERMGLKDYPVHIKLDTGMHRLGFNPVEDIDELISILKRQQAIIPRSVFTHFVGADDDVFDTFSEHQFNLFKQASDKIKSAFSHHILCHICNSAGIEHFSQHQLDMCRLGLGLYGISPRGNRLLNNVSTLKTIILQIRNVSADETIGYSRRGVLARNSRIAAIPIGYADGLNRHLGRGKAYCIVNGKEARYVGNICMDVAMIDVTDIECQEGDEVIIFGNQLPVTILSDAIDTIPYEILTGISNRVKRIYYHS